MSRTEILFSMLDMGIVLQVIPAAILCYIPMKNQKRRKRWVNLLCCVLLMIFAAITMPQVSAIFPRVDETVVLIPFLGMFFVYYAMSVRAHVSQCAGIFLMVCAFSAIPVFLAHIMDASHGGSAAEFTNSDLISRVMLISLLLIFVPLGLVLRKWGTYLVDRLHDSVTWYVLASVSAIITAIFSIMAPQEYELIKTPQVHRSYLIIFCLIATFYVLFIVFFLRIGYTLILKEELQEQETVYRMQSRQYQQIQDQTERLRVLRHDFKHSLGLIQGLAEQGDLEGIKKYLSGVTQAIPQQEVAHYCDDELINTILNYYAERARADGAKVKFLVDIPSLSEEQTIDIVSVLGNLLDNALHGLQTVPRDSRGIHLRMSVINDENLYIIVSNTFSGTVRKDGDRYLSTRRRRSVRGVGLRSIQLIAEKYGGEATAYNEGRIFNVDITMKIVK